MTIKLLTKTELAAINKKKLGYNLAIAEKDYMLAVAMKIISRDEKGKELVFKGGTAIHHCHIGQSRFSEDLDFTSVNTGIGLFDIKNIFMGFNFFELKEAYAGGKTLKIKRLKYSGPLAQDNSLKIEIDKFQNVALMPVKMKYNNAWGLDFEVNCMDIKEIFAEKIRAASGRARYRDFYDLVLIKRKYNFDMDEIKNIISKKERRYAIGGKYAIANWKTAKAEFESEKEGIRYLENVSETEITKLTESLDFEIEADSIEKD